MISCSVEQPVQESIIDSIIEIDIEIDIVELPLSISMIDSCTVEQGLKMVKPIYKDKTYSLASVTRQ